MFLLNDGAYPLTFESTYRSALQPEVLTSGDLHQGEWIELVALSMDQLHHQPEIRINSSWRRTDGILERPPFALRPRPRSIFSKMAPNPYFTFPAVLFPLAETAGKKEHIPVHTRRSPGGPSDRAYISSTPTPHMRATFEIELDLHAERLFSEPGKVSPADIFKRQMQVFEGFLKKALQVGVPHVFIIHGLGKGKLKKAIAERCGHYPEVNQVRNDYHPKYGFGASEITFY